MSEKETRKRKSLENAHETQAEMVTNNVLIHCKLCVVCFDVLPILRHKMHFTVSSTDQMRKNCLTNKMLCKLRLVWSSSMYGSLCICVCACT